VGYILNMLTLLSKHIFSRNAERRLCRVVSYVLMRQTKNINMKEFLKELKTLLEKYNAEISVEIDGDTHGVTDKIVIEVGKEEMYFENPSCFRCCTKIKDGVKVR
jgi:hypothetical protein